MKVTQLEFEWPAEAPVVKPVIVQLEFDFDASPR